MKWQKADEQLTETEGHIPVSRCASVIGLQLGSDPISKIGRRIRRKAKKEEGYVYDPFAPWRVLSIQCYPDWKSSIDSHDSTKHYVNGPEAFLVTLRAEYKDARKRLEEVFERVSDLVRMPVGPLPSGQNPTQSGSLRPPADQPEAEHEAKDSVARLYVQASREGSPTLRR